MRLRRKTGVAAVLVCIGVTVYEIPNVLLIWRQVRQAPWEDCGEVTAEDIKARLPKDLAATDRTHLRTHPPTLLRRKAPPEPFFYCVQGDVLIANKC